MAPHSLLQQQQQQEEDNKNSGHDNNGNQDSRQKTHRWHGIQSRRQASSTPHSFLLLFLCLLTISITSRHFASCAEDEDFEPRSPGAVIIAGDEEGEDEVRKPSSRIQDNITTGGRKGKETVCVIGFKCLSEEIGLRVRQVRLYERQKESGWQLDSLPPFVRKDGQTHTQSDCCV